MSVPMSWRSRWPKYRIAVMNMVQLRPSMVTGFFGMRQPRGMGAEPGGGVSVAGMRRIVRQHPDVACVGAVGLGVELGDAGQQFQRPPAGAFASLRSASHCERLSISGRLSFGSFFATGSLPTCPDNASECPRSDFPGG